MQCLICPLSCTQCLECLAALLTVSAAAREKLLSAATTLQKQRIAALFALLQSALRAPTPHERAAAEAVLEAFCAGNPAGQTQLASTLASPKSQGARQFAVDAHSRRWGLLLPSHPQH